MRVELLRSVCAMSKLCSFVEGALVLVVVVVENTNVCAWCVCVRVLINLGA